jgi:hypothetical protein
VAPAPLIQQQSNNPNIESPSHRVGDRLGSVLPATAAPSSIQGEVRANNSSPISPDSSRFVRSGKMTSNKLKIRCESYL